MRFGSRKIYSEFEKVANKFSTLKFIDFTDLEYVKKNFPNVKESLENLNGTVFILRKQSHGSRST